MSYILSLIWAFLETVFFVIFSKAFLQATKPPAVRILSCVIASAVMTLLGIFCKDPYVRQILHLFCFFLLSILLFKGPWGAHILISAICLAFGGFFATAFLYGTCALLGVSFEVFVWRKLSYTVVVTISKLIAILFAWLLLRFRKKGSVQVIRPKWLLLSLVFPVVSMIMLCVIYVSYQDRSDLSMGAFLFSIGLAIANVATLYLVQHLEVQAKEEQEIALLNQQMTIQTESIAALEESYKLQRKATHDFKNHLQAMQGLLANGDIPALEQYLQKLQNAQPSRILYVNSHHSVIDAVLNQHCQVATDANIDIQIQVNDLSTVTLPTDMLVVLLANLLDNAIEACQRLQGYGLIECRLAREAGRLFLSVRNSSLPVTILNNTIKTSKAPEKEHGYGLKNVCRILNQLQAEYSFSYEAGFFTFVAEIPN